MKRRNKWVWKVAMRLFFGEFERYAVKQIDPIPWLPSVGCCIGVDSLGDSYPVEDVDINLVDRTVMVTISWNGHSIESVNNSIDDMKHDGWKTFNDASQWLQE